MSDTTTTKIALETAVAGVTDLLVLLQLPNTGDDLGPIGTSIMNPDIEYHKIAEAMGWWAKGPIKDPAELGPAIKEAVAVVKSGQPALLNVWTQPR